MSKFKNFLVRRVLAVMGRAITVLGTKDAAVEEMGGAFNEGEVVRMCTMQGTACLDLICLNGKMRYAKPMVAQDAVLKFEFKNIEHLYKLCTARLSLHEAYAQHRMTVSGDIGTGMSVLRAVYHVEATLFPWFIAKHVLKKRIKGAAKIPTYCKFLFVKRINPGGAA